MLVAETIDKARALATGLGRTRGTMGLVPTMGALHDGHWSLVDRARAECAAVAVSIFVNPLQFGPNEDVDVYPQTRAADLAGCRSHGVDLVFAPTAAEMYASPVLTRVHVERLTVGLCGRARPGHFDGVCTVVGKLFNIIPAERAYFGEKDFQQLMVIRRMVRDLSIPVEIIACPVVRNPDGLAISSRNIHLSPDDRRRAAAIHAALHSAAKRVAAGERDAVAIGAQVESLILAGGAESVDYADAVDVESLEVLSRIDGPARLCVAARFGGVRLIDNVEVDAGTGGQYYSLMYPDLFTLPVFDWPVKSYGAMLTLGFLTGVWLSMKRAERLKMDPDMVLNIGFVCLLCGVGGARIFYVAHYWGTMFARRDNPVIAALDCTSGGLEYYGGLIGAIGGAMVYMAWKRVSIRMYLDLLAPAAAWGLAFGRMGCLLNGCCWGGHCVSPDGHPTIGWAIRFPHGSPAQTRQWENRQLAVPAEIIFTGPPGPIEPFLLPGSLLRMPVEKREEPARKLRELDRELQALKKINAPAEQLRPLQAERKEAVKKLQQHKSTLYALTRAREFPSRADPARGMTVTELSDLGHAHRSLPVHPAQVYGIINALLLSWLLLELLYRRKRHGLVFATLCMVYPVTRTILEVVRVDNPHDSLGLTISQAVSLGMFAFGIILFVVMYRLPLRSPRAIPFIPPPVEPRDAKS